MGKNKPMWGIAIIVLLSVLTVAIWLFVRAGTPTFNDYNTATYSFGQLTGLVALTLFSLTFLMTTRLKIVEKLFGGLDRGYRIHQITGSIAFVLALGHPLLLVADLIPSNLKQAAIYLLPSKSLAVNLGIIALVAMAALIILTIYISMKYQNWKLSHKLFGIVFFIAVAHSFLIPTDLTYYPLLWYFMAILSVIGIISYLYGSFLRFYLRRPYEYAVESVTTKGSVIILELAPVGKKLEHKAGQFAFIKFVEGGMSGEYHPFSISSSPYEKNLRFAIKSLGDYTADLQDAKKGMRVQVEGPYGAFNEFDESKNQVWVAGGIGITPFLALVSSLKDSKTKIDGTFFYSVKTREEAIFLGELTSGANAAGIRVIPWVAEEKGFLTAEKIASEAGENFSKSQFLICGPPAMMHALFGQLRQMGIRKSMVMFEDFSLK